MTLVVVMAGYQGAGPLAALDVTETRIEPQDVALPSEGADPLVLWIGVVWTEDGWCSGQFRVQATETSTEVRVGPVISREYRYRYGSCAGVGTVDNRAAADLRLAAPLGNRRVVRAGNGEVARRSFRLARWRAT